MNNFKVREGDIIHHPKSFFKWLIWAFFGNEKDGYIGDAVFNPYQIDNFSMRLRWWLRNPLHNFTWYVLGIAHFSTLRFDENETEQPGWNFSYSVIAVEYEFLKDKAPRYYFFHYIGKRFEFYLGWRGTGAFGAKFRRVRER